MKEQEIIKRLTDCVYFLASPLTCKKGIECEYRHSEFARLNPRDCWYWLEGGCFNVECAFRHPPLEGLKEAFHELSNPSNGPALLLDKANIPCYFYLKGFCSKGDKCSFLHGPAAPTVNNEVPIEKKVSAGAKIGSAPVKSNLNPPESVHIKHTHTVKKQTQNSHHVASGSAEKIESVPSEENVEQEEFVESEEYIEHEHFVQGEESVKLDEFVQSGSDVFDDQCSDDYVEREGWLKSLIGFDVLVEGDPETQCYEQDADYFTAHDEEHREFDVHYAEYNPDYTKLVNRAKEVRYEYDVHDRVDKVSMKPQDSIFYRLSFQKRNVQPEAIYNSRRGSDLREHLKKRKVVNGGFFKRYDSARLVNHRFREYPKSHVSRREFDIDHRARLRKPVYLNRYRLSVRDNRFMKPLFFSSEVARSRYPAPQYKRESHEESAVFTGPKTLDQIKEEKQKALQNLDLDSRQRSFHRSESDDFQGPRPLSEILKDKRKLY